VTGIGHQSQRSGRQAAGEFDDHEQRGQRKGEAQDFAAGASAVVMAPVTVVIVGGWSAGVATVSFMLVRVMPMPGGPVLVLVHRSRISRLVFAGQRVKPARRSSGRRASANSWPALGSDGWRRAVSGTGLCSLTICARMKLSVVIPVCNEADNVGPLAREIQAALADHRPFEIIFVDDRRLAPPAFRKSACWSTPSAVVKARRSVQACKRRAPNGS
jgi:hypothetical protein